MPSAARHALAAAAAAAAFTIGLQGPALAQLQRNFPQNALRGALVVTEQSGVLLNGRPASLAAGAKIRGQSNMIELPGSLVGARLLVNYTFDLNGQVKDVWILRPEEAAVRPWPTTPEEADRWTFDPVAQTWSKP